MNSKFSYQEDFWMNSRGKQLFTCKWLPFYSPKGLIFLCHGYGVECSTFMRELGTKFSCAGYAVFGLDLEGHGRSEGVRCHIPKFEHIVDDSYDYFKTICERPEYKRKDKFIYGDSMGGAVAILLHRKDPSLWDGAILVAPMCKISEKLKPHPIVVNILNRVGQIVPKWKIVPSKDIIETGFQDQAKREAIRKNKYVYQDKPRLKTAFEMMKISMEVESILSEITIPFIVLQGELDRVTDPEVCKALYEQASSEDKTLKLYPGMWHGITTGESDENIELVLTDIITWMDMHIKDTSFERLRSNKTQYRVDSKRVSVERLRSNKTQNSLRSNKTQNSNDIVSEWR